jgi:hypothetical protein
LGILAPRAASLVALKPPAPAARREDALAARRPPRLVPRAETQFRLAVLARDALRARAQANANTGLPAAAPP